MLEKRSAIIGVLFIIVISVVFVYSFKPNKPNVNSGEKAAIIDGLSVEFPNTEFITRMSEILNELGYNVDYFQSENVTVSLYKKIPTQNYNLIIFRVHSAPMDPGKNPGVALFTSEVPPGAYLAEQMIGWVRIAKTLTGEDQYYAVTPSFFKEALEGEFDETTIITMSCFSTIDSALASTFMEKGAKMFVGWDEKVTSDHMDKYVLKIFETIEEDGIEFKEAAERVVEEIGPDPVYGSRLRIYYSANN